MGKRRNSATTILLSLFTFGIYWFYWLHEAFAEVARARGRRWRSGLWVWTLLPVWLLGNRIREQLACATQPDCGPYWGQAVMDRVLPTSVGSRVLVGLSVVVLAYFALQQLVYLLEASDLLSQEYPAAYNDLRASRYALVFASIAFPLANGATMLPVPADRGLRIVATLAIVGLLIASLVVAIFWVVKVQRILNAFWKLQAVPASTNWVSPAMARG